MTTSVGNSKVYLFLAKTDRTQGDWEKYADKKYGDSNGVVSQSEFEQFINAEYEGAMGEKLSSRDFNLFWSSIDTDKVDFRDADGDKVNGAYNLSAKEIEALDKEMEDFVKLDVVCEKAVANLKGLFVNPDDIKQWKTLVTTKLALALEEWRANGRPCDDFEKYMTTNSEGIQKFATIQAEATATVQKDNVIDEWLKDKNRYWDELAALEPPFDVMEFINQSGVVEKLVKKYVTAETKAEDIPNILTIIRDKMEVEIKKALALHGLNEKGEAIQQPELDENGEVKVDDNGNVIVDTDSEKITDENIQSWTAQLIALLESKDFMDAIPADHKPYASVYKEAGKTWINNKIADLRNSCKTFTEFKTAVDEINAASIVKALKSDPEISGKIDNEIQIQTIKNGVWEWFNIGKLEESLFVETDSTYVNGIINQIKESGFMDSIKSYITSNLDALIEKHGTSDATLITGEISKYAKEQLAKAIGNACQNGMGVNAFSTEDLVASLNNNYGILSIYENGLSDTADKNYYRAQITVGHLWDIYKTDYGKEAINEIFKGDSWQDVKIWANMAPSDIQTKLKEVHDKMIKIANKTEGQTQQEGETNIDSSVTLKSFASGTLRTSTGNYNNISGARTDAIELLTGFVNGFVECLEADEYQAQALQAAEKSTISYFSVIINNAKHQLDGKKNGKSDSFVLDPFTYTGVDGKPKTATGVQYKECQYNDGDYNFGGKSACGVTLFRNMNGAQYSGWQFIIEKDVVVSKFKEFFKAALNNK